VAHKGRSKEVVEIFAKWDLDAVVIGHVHDDGRMRVKHEGEVVCDVPVMALTDEAPIYERAMRAPVSSSEFRVSSSPDAVSSSEFRVSSSQTETSEISRADSADKRANLNETNSKLETRNSKLVEGRNSKLLYLLSSSNLASKEWVYRQYDHMVRTNTVVLPGADAAVVRIKETRKALAIALDGNGRYCAANPREGAKLAVAEAARNVVCVGAKPIAVTNCLNFASPERPEVMWSFSEVIDGIAEACRAFNTPVVSGNVSFYNETEGRGVLPTPVIGMVGLIEDVKRVIQPGFKKEGDVIALLGKTENEGQVPALDLQRELAVQAACLRAAEAGLLRSAHDCSEGGLAVALAESCFSSLNRDAIGAQISLESGAQSLESKNNCAPSDSKLQTSDSRLQTPDSLLFSESPSRIIISFDESARSEIEAIATDAGAPITILGTAGGDRLRIKVGEQEVVNSRVAEMEAVWRSSLKLKLQAEAMAAGAE
ncbi:MAG: AIR synthase related protein, partial [Pyrinomonadaceae bacterium]